MEASCEQAERLSRVVLLLPAERLVVVVPAAARVGRALLEVEAGWVATAAAACQELAVPEESMADPMAARATVAANRSTAA
jgi:hypothetical protein